MNSEKLEQFEEYLIRRQFLRVSAETPEIKDVSISSICQIHLFPKAKHGMDVFEFDNLHDALYGFSEYSRNENEFNDIKNSLTYQSDALNIALGRKVFIYVECLSPTVKKYV